MKTAPLLIEIGCDQRLEFIPVVEEGRFLGVVPITAVFQAAAGLALTPDDSLLLCVGLVSTNPVPSLLSAVDTQSMSETATAVLTDPPGAMFAARRNLAISRDGRTAAINVTFMPMTDGEFVDRDIDGQIRRILEREAAPGQRYYVTGRPHIRSEAHHMLVRDILRLIPIAVAVVEPGAASRRGH